jgi:hypothetical protein
MHARALINITAIQCASGIVSPCIMYFGSFLFRIHKVCTSNLVWNTNYTKAAITLLSSSRQSSLLVYNYHMIASFHIFCSSLLTIY